MAVIEAIEEESLIEKAVQMGQYTRQKLQALKPRHTVIDHVRGVGLMIGIQLTVPGAAFVNECLERGLRINCTHESVIRFMPPMIVTAEQIDQAVDIFDSVLGQA